jgi:AcrR family transcriptional regulator
MTDSPATRPVTPGRPRDPDVDRRVAIAAVDVYAAVGWEGFNLDLVAKQARAGKASIYRRWQSKEQLLAEAIILLAEPRPDTNTGTLRGDLTALGQSLLNRYFGTRGKAMLRIGIEARSIPGLAEEFDRLARAEILAARAMVRRAVARGELPPGASPTVVLDMLSGGIMSHALATPPDLLEKARRGLTEYLDSLIDAILWGVLRGPEHRHHGEAAAAVR